MKLFLPRLLAVLSISVSSLFATQTKAADSEERQDLQRAFLSFYLSVGPARAATAPAEVVKAGASSWHLPDEKTRRSLDDFGAWLLAAKPTDLSVEKVKTAGALARMTILFAHVEEPHPARAEVTLVRLGNASGNAWKIVKFDLRENDPADPVSSNGSLPAPSEEDARETLESYLKRLSKLATDPNAQATAANPQQLASDLAEWWVDNKERSQARAMTQGAMFFRLYQPKDWTIKPAGTSNAATPVFNVTVQPGNEVSRRLGPKTMVFGLTRSKTSGWENLQLHEPPTRSREMKMMKILTLLTAAALLLSSCFEGNGDIDLDQFPTTPWGTAIIDGMDTELPGTWVLVREIVSANNQSLTVPFAGRTLTIQGDGVFREDYSTENHIDPNLRRHFSVEGRSGGQMRVEVVMDLDAPEEKPRDIFELLTRRDMSIGPKRALNQMGEYRTSATTFPLGAGRVHTYPDGQWVRCEYELIPNEINDYNELRISTMIGSQVTWIFRRSGTPELAIEQNPPTSDINIYSAAVMDQISQGTEPIQPETPEEEANALPSLGVGFFVEVLYPAGDLFESIDKCYH